ncbi:MAG TPA: MATE family efflux transporter, partial [Ruminococcaceae bacterium]|nr:MATE family efflux transporter [Oscillospiraceae bacterium]
MNKDLTIGDPGKALCRFCLPLFGSVIFQQLYNIADSWVAGRYVGENALAAVGNSYEITLVYLAFAFGCNIGCSVITSRFFGAGEYGKMKTTVKTSLLLGAGVCLLLMLVGVLGADALLSLIRTPANVFADSKCYLDIYTFGLPFVFFYNISTGIFSALGDSITPFRFLAVSSVSNVAVDILFVKAFHMGVAGVAWATFLCQGVSCVLAVIAVLMRLKTIPTAQPSRLFDVQILKQILAIAVPSTLQQSFISIGNIVIQGIINGFGSGVMAGYSAGVKLNNLVVTSFTTIGNGMSNFTAQNIGAKKTERISSGLRAGVGLVWAISFAFCGLFFAFTNPLLRFFLDNPSALAVSSGVLFLRILSPFYFVLSVKLVADGVLRGAGKMKLFMIATFTDLILRVVLAFVLSETALGSTGIWCA